MAVLTGKTALITGGGGLMARMEARALLREGCKVVLGDINMNLLWENQSLLQAEFPDSDTIETASVDVSYVPVLRDFVRKYDLDILINNAANNPKQQDLQAYSPENWKADLDVGLTGTYLCCEVFGWHMVEKQSGVIVNIGSDLSIIAPDQRIYKDDHGRGPNKPPSYSAIKHGVVGLTKYYGTLYAPHGVRVNCLCPGGVDDNHDDEFKSKLTNLIPMGRMANLDDYEGAIRFLCTDDSRYMTGQNLVIDGGRTVW